MTKRKWLRLRRNRPELFQGYDLPPPEKWTDAEHRLIRSLSKKKAVTMLTAFKLTQ